MRHVAVLSLFLLSTACSDLIIRDNDSATVVIGKVVARTLIVIPTLGISELTIVDLKDEDRNRAWRKQLLPQDELACRRLWDEYLADRQRQLLFERAPHLAASIVAFDYFGEAMHALRVTGLIPEHDEMHRAWLRSVALDPQVALFSECSRRYGIRRFFPQP